MSMNFNNYSGNELRRYLRNNSTKAERMLWMSLKNKQLNGYKFRRQYGVDCYIVDFYRPKLKLAIEIDGNHHFTPDIKEYDQQRQDHIEAYGIRFLRFTNKEVYTNIDEVLKNILEFIKSNPLVKD